MLAFIYECLYYIRIIMKGIMNYNVINGDNGRILKVWNEKVPIEEQAIEQLLDTLKLPFVSPYIAVMPDCHAGKGSSVGSVIPCEGAIIPAAVGMDIACGMSAYKLIVTRDDFIGNEELVRNALIRAVPAGRTNDGGLGDRGAWNNIPSDVQDLWDRKLATGFEKMKMIPGLINARTNSINHLGTLGTGNHFLSLSTDEAGGIWLIVHSGSRGIGGRIGNYFIKRAQELCAQWFIELPNRDLAYLPAGTKTYDEYISCMHWCNTFASTSRVIMLNNACNAIQDVLGIGIDMSEYIDCHHNFVEKSRIRGKDLNIIRKGATRASIGDRIIIPGAMGKKSFIANGLGSIESFYSCSHGAGRLMSRTAAKNTITVEEHIKDTEGVFCDKDVDIIDESPKAYKNVDDVMASQKGLVEIDHTLQEFINVKGKNDKRKKRRG